MLNPEDNSSTIVSPAAIEKRSEAFDTAQAAPVEAKPTVVAEKPKAEVKENVAPVTAVKPAVKAPLANPLDANANKVEPQTDSELRKWATKNSQDNASLRKDIEALRKLYEESTKKPIDLDALRKDPAQFKKYFDDQAIAQQTLQNNYQIAVNQNKMIAESNRRMHDPKNYPDWKKAAAVIDHLYNTKDQGLLNLVPDGNWNAVDAAQGLDLAYEYAKPLIGNFDWNKVPGFEDNRASLEAEYAKRVAEAEQRGYEKAVLESKNRSNGSTIAGMSGARTSKRPIETDYRNMDIKELEKLVSKNRAE